MRKDVEALNSVLSENGIRCFLNCPTFISLGCSLDFLNAPISLHFYESSVTLSVAYFEVVPVVRDLKAWFSVELDDPLFIGELVALCREHSSYYSINQLVMVGSERHRVKEVLDGSLRLSNGAIVKVREQGMLPLKVNFV